MQTKQRGNASYSFRLEFLVITSRDGVEVHFPPKFLHTDADTKQMLDGIVDLPTEAFVEYQYILFVANKVNVLSLVSNPSNVLSFGKTFGIWSGKIFSKGQETFFMRDDAVQPIIASRVFTDEGAKDHATFQISLK